MYESAFTVLCIAASTSALPVPANPSDMTMNKNQPDAQ
jgi:hypothetical protein